MWTERPRRWKGISPAVTELPAQVTPCDRRTVIPAGLRDRGQRRPAASASDGILRFWVPTAPEPGPRRPSCARSAGRCVYMDQWVSSVGDRGPASRSSDLLSLGSFVVLGLPDGMLGTAWPSMRATFGAPVGDLGLILLLATAGSVLVTAFVGPLIRRLGVPALLAVAGAVAALGYTGFALAPGLWLVLAVAVLLGASAGMMDAGLNTAVALTGRPRLLNLLHGAYGVGTAIGPLVVTAAILTGSWRPAYLVQVVLDLVLAALWLRQRRRDRAPSRRPRPRPPSRGAPSEPHPAAQWSRRRYSGVVVAGMSVFFVYTGLEVGAGQWEASFCRGHLNLSAAATGLAAFGYWGALTAVRIGLAVLPRPVRPQAVVRWGSVLAVLAAAVDLVAARHRRDRDRLRGARRRAGRRLPGPDLAHPGPPRRAAGPARHLLAGRRGRRRGSGHLRAHRPAHRRHQPGRPRPGHHRPRADRRRRRADPAPPRPDRLTDPDGRECAWRPPPDKGCRAR